MNDEQITAYERWLDGLEGWINLQRIWIKQYRAFGSFFGLNR